MENHDNKDHAELIDKLGVERVSETTQRSVDVVMGWRERGVPKRFQRRLAKMADGLDPMAPQDEEKDVEEHAERVASSLQVLKALGAATTTPDKPLTAEPNERAESAAAELTNEETMAPNNDRDGVVHPPAVDRQRRRAGTVRRRPSVHVERSGDGLGNRTVHQVEQPIPSPQAQPKQEKKTCSIESSGRPGRRRCNR